MCVHDAPIAGPRTAVHASGTGGDVPRTRAVTDATRQEGRVGAGEKATLNTRYRDGEVVNNAHITGEVEHLGCPIMSPTTRESLAPMCRSGRPISALGMPAREVEVALHCGPYRAFHNVASMRSAVWAGPPQTLGRGTGAQPAGARSVLLARSLSRNSRVTPTSRS